MDPSLFPPEFVWFGVCGSRDLVFGGRVCVCVCVYSTCLPQNTDTTEDEEREKEIAWKTVRLEMESTRRRRVFNF